MKKPFTALVGLSIFLSISTSVKAGLFNWRQCQIELSSSITTQDGIVISSQPSRSKYISFVSERINRQLGQDPSKRIPGVIQRIYSDKRSKEISVEIIIWKKSGSQNTSETVLLNIKELNSSAIRHSNTAIEEAAIFLKDEWALDFVYVQASGSSQSSAQLKQVERKTVIYDTPPVMERSRGASKEDQSTPRLNPTWQQLAAAEASARRNADLRKMGLDVPQDDISANGYRVPSEPTLPSVDLGRDQSAAKEANDFEARKQSAQERANATGRIITMTDPNGITVEVRPVIEGPIPTRDIPIRKKR